MKTTFWTNWGWSRLSEWGGGVRLPDAVRLPDGQVFGLSIGEYEGAAYRHFNEHPRSRAKYVPMNATGTVRLSYTTGGTSGGRSSGQRWAVAEVIAPRGSIFLYGGMCPHCEKEVEYSEDPDSPGECSQCLAFYEEQQRLVDEQWERLQAGPEW